MFATTFTGLYDDGIELGAKIILAEVANRIYRDTSYHDLISFEEDIAKLVALIVVIAESPGSLAELGAFASISNIRSKLRVIVRQKHADEESFIRFGPIQRVRRDDEGFVDSFLGELIVGTFR